MNHGDETALRIVLFGMPDAGKSSLLGALAQAAPVQEQVLRGRLVDHSNGLLELQRRLYEDRPRETLEEVTPYPVALEPLAGSAAAAREAVLVDCDGRVANELLSNRRASGDLAQAIVEADTLVLVVDASASAAAMERDFGQFGRYLHLLEQNRGRRADVGGLPVYLVLSKCDLLAKEGDSNIVWMERIEERKRQIDQRFKDFLAGATGQAPLPFGRIELHVWATAVKRPALKDAPAKPREPYGVAELFRQCLDSAVTFRQRQAQAARRLRLLLGGVLGLVAAMALLTLYFLATRPDRQTTTLDNEVRAFRSGNDRPAELLRDPEDRIKQLQRIESDPDFSGLPTELKEYVSRTLAELNAYRQYNKEFLARVGDPRYAHSLEALSEIEENIRKLPPPASYQASWAQSPALQRQGQWLQDAELLRREVGIAVARLTNLIRRSQRLADESIPVGEYRKLLDELLHEDERLPYREAKRNRYLPGSNRLTYDTIMQFDSVDAAWREWEAAKRKMKAAAQ
jgi:hypothetical protein